MCNQSNGIDGIFLRGNNPSSISNNTSQNSISNIFLSGSQTQQSSTDNSSTRVSRFTRIATESVDER